jgi:hypothetical protein
MNPFAQVDMRARLWSKSYPLLIQCKQSLTQDSMPILPSTQRPAPALQRYQRGGCSPRAGESNKLCMKVSKRVPDSCVAPFIYNHRVSSSPPSAVSPYIPLRSRRVPGDGVAAGLEGLNNHGAQPSTTACLSRSHQLRKCLR